MTSRPAALASGAPTRSAVSSIHPLLCVLSVLWWPFHPPIALSASIRANLRLPVRGSRVRAFVTPANIRYYSILFGIIRYYSEKSSRRARARSPNPPPVHGFLEAIELTQASRTNAKRIEWIWNGKSYSA